MAHGAEMTSHLKEARESIRLALTEPHGDDAECLADAIGRVLDYLDEQHQPASPSADETATGGELPRRGCAEWQKEAADSRDPILYAWRCSSCGELLDDQFSGAWRWNGEQWEHRCPGSHPQSGHAPARCFGLRSSQPPAPPAPETTGGKCGTTCCIGCRCEECRKRFYLPAEGQSAEGTGAPWTDLLAMFRGYEFHASVCGDRKVLKLTAEQGVEVAGNALKEAESRGAERVTACWKNDMAQIDELLKARRYIVEDDDTRWRLVKHAFGDLESKLAAVEKERDEALAQAAEYEQMRLDERTALGPQLRELTAARDALSKKVEAWSRIVNWACEKQTTPDERAHQIEAAVADLPANFRPGEREAKGEAR